jgi:iron(III) transport system substrate-binding protein
MSRSHRHALLTIAAISLGFLAGCEDKPADPGANGPVGEAPKAEAPKAEPPRAEPPRAEPPKEEESLTIYCGRTEELVGAALAEFEKDSGVKLRIKYGGSQELAAALLKEGDKSPADVFFAQDISTLAWLSDKEILSPMPEAAVAGVKAGNFDAQRRWVGVSGRARVLAYNTERVKPEELPKTVEELTDPKWKGRVGWAPENASFKSFVAAMLQLRGPEATQSWLEGMKRNEPKAYPKNTPAVRAAASGEVDVALVNHYYLFRVQAEEGKPVPVANHYFRNSAAESMVNLSGVGVVKSSAKQALALKLVAHLLGKKSQMYFAQKSYEFPVTSDVAADETLPALEGLNPPALKEAEMDNLEATEALLQKSGVLP